MHCNYNVNPELKHELKKNKITYADIAQELSYAKTTIRVWLCHPLSEEHKEMILGAISRIKSKKGGKCDD